jgi:hypothetical protein
MGKPCQCCFGNAGPCEPTCNHWITHVVYNDGLGRLASNCKYGLVDDINTVSKSTTKFNGASLSTHIQTPEIISKIESRATSFYCPVQGSNCDTPACECELEITDNYFPDTISEKCKQIFALPGKCNFKSSGKYTYLNLSSNISTETFMWFDANKEYRINWNMSCPTNLTPPGFYETPIAGNYLGSCDINICGPFDKICIRRNQLNENNSICDVFDYSTIDWCSYSNVVLYIIRYGASGAPETGSKKILVNKAGWYLISSSASQFTATTYTYFEEPYLGWQYPAFCRNLYTDKIISGPNQASAVEFEIEGVSPVDIADKNCEPMLNQKQYVKRTLNGSFYPKAIIKSKNICKINNYNFNGNIVNFKESYI